MVKPVWIEGVGFRGSPAPVRDKSFMEMAYYKQLTIQQQEAALMIKCAIVLNNLKSDNLSVLSKLDPRLVSDFKYLSFCLYAKRDAAVIRDLKRRICQGLIQTVVKTIYYDMFPKRLDPPAVFTQLVTHPNEPYRSFIHD